MIADPVPLDGLDSVPRADLAHAYGSAADVPVILRAPARPEPDPERAERLDGLDDLDVAIHHLGGAVYPAGAGTLPFLPELAALRALADLGPEAPALAPLSRTCRDRVEPGPR
ncbi:hypothetical protein ABZ800_22030 [Streptomyces sp. NPDC047813]|uniref:hypothetical protein n=1 Tax=Streptomyces sp. NPDC047813 TaxID=3154608 RepID=UPI0034079DB1